MGILKKILKGAAVISAIGTGLVLFDVQQKKVYSNQPFSEALRHYFTVNGLARFGSVSQKRLEKATKQVFSIQEEFLMKQLKENEDTAYGRNYNFATIKNVADFRQNHPLTRYSHYQQYIDSMMQGDHNVLSKHDPVIFAVTSGTSGNASILPMQMKQRRLFFAEGVSLVYRCMADAFPASTNLHKDFKIMYSPTWRMSKSGIKIGPNSSTPDDLRKMMFMYTTPEAVFDIPSEPDALYAHLLFALQDSSLGIIEANFASLVYYTFIRLESELPNLIMDIAHGTLNPQLSIPLKIRKSLEEKLVANPDRAHQVERAWREGGRVGLGRRLWPNLQVVLCADSGAFALYGDKLRATFLKGVPIYSPLYAATEGLLGVNIWPRDLPSKYLLHPRAMFFELIPVTHSEEDQPQTVLMHEAEIGEMYELVITNASGLYRYRLGDVVKVCGFHHEAPIIEFMYRQGQLLNVRGEKLPESAFYDALLSCIKTWPGFKLVDYCCVENFMLEDLNSKEAKKIRSRYPCYHVFLEAEGFSAKNWIVKDQVKKMDAELSLRSYPYQSYRTKGSIGEVQIHLLQPGSFQALKEHMVQKGSATSIQYKTPRVLKSKETVEFLLQRVLQ